MAVIMIATQCCDDHTERERKSEKEDHTEYV